MNKRFPFTSPRPAVMTRISMRLLRRSWQDSAPVACSSGQFNYTSLQLRSLWPCFILPNPSLLCPGVTSQLNYLHTSLCLKLNSLRDIQSNKYYYSFRLKTIGEGGLILLYSRKLQFSRRMSFLKRTENNLVAICLFLPF